MITSMTIFGIVLILSTSFLSSIYATSGDIDHHDPSFSPFFPLPFSPPCIPTNMLLDSVSAVNIQYDCSIPNTLHTNVS